MNVFVYATLCERMFEDFLNSVGMTRRTTFFADLSVAEWCEGAKGVKDTYKRVFKEWKNDVVYMAEFVIALDQKIWMHYEHNKELAQVYSGLWMECEDFCREHFKGVELSYYYKYLDLQKFTLTFGYNVKTFAESVSRARNWSYYYEYIV